MKQSMIHNISTNLERSSFNTQMSGPAEESERLLNIESHLRLPKVNQSIFERIKRIEDRIIEIEAMYPNYAAFVFNQSEKNDLVNSSLFQTAVRTTAKQSVNPKEVFTN
jgi:hypothetical protein